MDKTEKILLDIINNKYKISRKIQKKLSDTIQSVNSIQNKDIQLYHIEELTFEEKAPRKESLENVLASLRIDGLSFVYLLIGDKNKISFYFGIAKVEHTDENNELDVDEASKSILKSSIEGNFRGSKISLQEKENKKKIIQTIANFKRVARIDGVAMSNEDDESFQGIDRLVDIMLGDEFAMMIISDPLTHKEILDIEDILYTIHNKLTPFAKFSLQETKGKATTKTTTKGESESKTKGENSSQSESDSKGTNAGTNQSNTSGYTPSGGGDNSSTTKGASEGMSENFTVSVSKGESVSVTHGSSDSISEAEAVNSGSSKSREITDKLIANWIEYIDEILLKRLDYGKNRGLFHSCTYLLANDKLTITKLGNTVKSIFNGNEKNEAPLEIVNDLNKSEIESIKNFQIPTIVDEDTQNIFQAKILFSRARTKIANWLSTKELSVIASLPQKEVVGLALKEEVEFGLNIKQNIKEEDKLLLGNLVKSGTVLDIEVGLNKSELNKHIFIAGVTGSGKTTTCQRILNSANYPFMVIEPAKTEYRVLTKADSDILIFTLGNDRVAPFRLNPFEIFPGENITSRVDMIKANIEAAFDMEAAIPQIIESALYSCYEEYGWDISTSTNSRYKDPFADGVYAFPTLSDLIKQTEVVVEKQGFDERLKNDYIGSIKARLQGLLVGAKGSMLNTPRSVDFTDLLEKKVIFELEEIKNGAEKSLVMGFILINLNEALKQKYKEYRKQNKNFKHITLIEEAHRLLSKYTPGENPSKKLGIEAFADMLAEVRKYGESLIIVDQIPNKLTPEVLKNTNTKIVHRLFASDDKEAIGNTMALEDEQKEFLSSLEVGRVIVSNQNFSKPIQLQIREFVSTTTEDEVDESKIRQICLEYYQQNYKAGIIQGLEIYEEIPSIEVIEQFLRLNLNGLDKIWRELFSLKNGNLHGAFHIDLRVFLEENRLLDKLDMVEIYLLHKFYGMQKEDFEDIKNHLKEFLMSVSNGKNSYSRDDTLYLKIR